jgi:Domain of Unknown Function with PDB structure (DUF3857)/Transglutaminase-like superfamily
MRLQGGMRFAALVLALLSPGVLRAQFQEPSKEERQMTADPKAPGASAVYLYLEDITDQSNKTRSYYERIKVLTEKGKEMATVHLPYEPSSDKIADVEGRTVHPDGTVIPLTDKPSYLVDVKTKGYQLNSLVVTLPSVEVGSILEYRVRIKYSSAVEEPVWMIQHDSPVVKAHYVFKSSNTYFSNLGYVSRFAADAKVTCDKKGTCTLDVSNVPALPDDDWMPPLNTLKWRVSFFYTTYKSGEEFWKEAGKTWGTVVREIVNPTGGLKKAAAELIAPGDTETQKAEKIYAAVMKIENTDFTREKSKVERKKEKIKDIKTVEDVWKQKRGSSNDIALLYVALCHAAGLKVDPMAVVDRSLAVFDEGLLSPLQMDDYIAVGQLDGKEIYLDPGEKMCPFGILHWKHYFAAGFRLVDKEGVLRRVPSANYTSSTVSRVADLTVDESGGVKGLVRFVLTGQDALYWRQLVLKNDEDEIKKQFNESMRDEIPEGVQAEFDHFLGLDDYTSNLMGIVRVSGNLGAATGKRFFFPGLFFESHAKHPFVSEDKRTIPVDVHFPRTEIDDITYHLPAGFTVESAPQKYNLSWPDHALFKVLSAQQGNMVEVGRSLSYNYTILDPKEYSGLHDFYQKVASADQQQLVLTRSAVAKGKP